MGHSAQIDFGFIVCVALVLFLNLFGIFAYVLWRICHKQRVGIQHEWDDVAWFRVHNTSRRNSRSLFSGIHSPGQITPRRRSLDQSHKFPESCASFTKKMYAELEGSIEKCCCICLEEYDDKSELKVLPCGHWHHVDCIEKWFIRDVTCPLCKERAIQTPYSQVISTTGNGSPRAVNRRPSLSTLIREALSQNGEVLVVYDRNTRSNRFMSAISRLFPNSTRFQSSTVENISQSNSVTSNNSVP